MLLFPGSRIGPYEIVAPIGAGGMGEVYRARDARLDRDVAIKILPGAFLQDADRLARFTREARTLAALNHPNIAQIYGLEQLSAATGTIQPGSISALVMELVEGDDLSVRIARGAMPLDEALAAARQIAGALEAAHERGIIHRDLKPANIKVSADGAVKVLDFGLAKALDASAPDDTASDAPTITSPAVTEAGVILGTAAYMSPEQARGKPVDKRADTWAFGCVLYEMLTGVRAFRAGTVTDTLAAIVRSEPDWQQLPADTPVAVRRLLARCLEKDARRRLRDIGEARIALEDLAGGGSGTVIDAAPPTPVSPWRRALPAAAAAFALVAVLAAGVVMWRASRTAPAPVVRLAIVPPSAAPLFRPARPAIAITPDGREVVYVSGSGDQLSVRALDALEPRHLTNLGLPAYPFISPDGRFIGFFDGLNALKVVPIGGGPATTLCTLRGAAGRGGTWTRDGHIIFATDDPATGLWRVPERGGTPELLTSPRDGEGDQLWPQLLPDGGAVLVTVLDGPDLRARGARVGVVDLKTGAVTMLFQGAGARYVSTGHLIYSAAGALRAVGFDPGRREVRGTPVSILEGIAGGAASGTTGVGALGLAVADDGTLAYVPAVAQAARRLVWVDREGREELLPAPPRGYVMPRISPDGSRIAIDTRDDAGADIWIWDLKGRALSRVTFGTSVYPVWSRDGARLVHTTFDEARVGRLFVRVPDGSTREERLTEGPNSRYSGSVTRDGLRVLFREEAGDTGLDIGSVPIGGDGAVETVLRTPANEFNPELSPDGRWLAYESNQTGENEIYVRPFPDVHAGLWQVTTTGGREPAWSRTTSELFYRAPDGAVMAVPVRLEPRFAAGQASAVVRAGYFNSGVYRSYDVAADGRFLMLTGADDTGAGQSASTIVIVQNWFEELRRLGR